MGTPYCPNHIVSKYKTVKAAKAYVEKIEENANEYVWLNEFDKTGHMGATVLAVSKPMLNLMEKIDIEADMIIGKPMFIWGNLFVNHMRNTIEDADGADIFFKAQKGMHDLTKQDKQVVPLSVSFFITEPECGRIYKTLVMSEQFVRKGKKGKKDVILVTGILKDISEEEYKALKTAQKTVSFLCDDRSPQRWLEEKAIMTEILKQVIPLVTDLQNFSGNLCKLLKDAPIPVHFNTKKEEVFTVIACSEESRRFLKLKEKDIINKPVWNFFSGVQKSLKITPEHFAKFIKCQQHYETLLSKKQDHPLPDSHVAAKFGDEAECYIIHFHREHIYTNDGQPFGDLVFMPFEEITYQHFLLLEQTDSLLVEEEAIILDEGIELPESARAVTLDIDVDRKLDEIESEIMQLLKQQ